MAQITNPGAANAAPKEPVLVVTELDDRLTTKIIQKLFGKHGKVLGVTEASGGPTLEHPNRERCLRVEFEKPADAAVARDALHGKKALGKRLHVRFETDLKVGADRVETMAAIEAKLAKLEKGIDAEAEFGKKGKAMNKLTFNRGGKGTAIWNGAGTTRTKASPTLFVTNIPRGHVNIPAVTAVFKDDPGFFKVRMVRHMAFVDYESVAHATKSMIKHQNYRMPGIGLGHGGLVIDYDKDSRAKRNRAYEKDRPK